MITTILYNSIINLLLLLNHRQTERYCVWVAKYWNWTASIPIDPETNTFANLKENGCLIHKDDSVIMLVDPAVGGKIN
jgi:hypothetical protein